MTYKTTDKKIAKIAKIANKNLDHHYTCQINHSDTNLSNDKTKILTNTYKCDIFDKNIAKENKYIENKKFGCENCNYYTNNKTDYNKHLSTKKHIKKNSFDCDISANFINNLSSKQFHCECGKLYKHRQSLYTHQKNCNFIKNENKNENEKEDEINYKEYFYTIMNQIKSQGEQNNILQNTLIELIPKIKNEKEMVNYNNQITQNNINNINQNLNINIFLNENCKDAMSIGDFVKNIQVSIEDLLLNKEKGIIEGISNLIIKHLKEIPLIQRPLWCSDKKKKKLFIKNVEWEEDIDNIKTNQVIDNVSRIQSKNINKYIYDKPKWIENETVKDTYISIVKNATEPLDNKRSKIINKLIDTIYFTQEDVNAIKNKK